MITASQQPTSPTFGVPVEPARNRRIGIIVAGSIASGLVAALLLVAAPFVEPRENVLAGAVLLAFAAGWLLLAVLSVGFSDQPQRWAIVPAAFLALVGLVTISGPAPVRGMLGWVGPPILFGIVAWSFVHARGGLPRRTRRWLLYPVLASLALASVGAGYQTVGRAVDVNHPSMPGQLIDVGGRRLHLNCTGSGSPTVVLEPGLWATSAAMAWVAPAVANHGSRVCVYDRAGRGWSDPADGPLDGAQTAADLHTLLERAHIPGPYVLAGHSFGGLYVLTFAARYPDDVAGLVLIDSTEPVSTPPPPRPAYNLTARFLALLPATAHLGIPRLLGQFSDSGLPPAAEDQIRARGATAETLRSFVDELGEGSTAGHQAAALEDFGAKPLIVITAGLGHDATWAAAQKELATLSTNSRHRIVDATHASLLLDQADAVAASQAIREVAAAVRDSHRLT